ncbi:MAG: hypothetical protein JNK05_04825 [Myxococcales bacterium]|nr:hypothetical protein [Myxococcales bacterium]
MFAALRSGVFVLALGAGSISCASQRATTTNQLAAAQPNAALQSTSTINCATDADCAVCYRGNSCGEPIAANDPALETPACHVTPAAFCMPRRGRCEERHCVAR